SSVSFLIVSYSTMSISSVTSSFVISGGLVTLTVAVSVLPSTVAVIVAVPSAIAVTNPLASTVAIASLSDVYATLLFVALDGSTVAFNCLVAPTSKLFVLGAIVTPVTAIGFVFTMTVAFSDRSEEHTSETEKEYSVSGSRPSTVYSFSSIVAINSSPLYTLYAIISSPFCPD